jgi:hypothetical protein
MNKKVTTTTSADKPEEASTNGGETAAATSATPLNDSGEEVESPKEDAPKESSTEAAKETEAAPEQALVNFGVDEKSCSDKLDYYQNIVRAVDRLYPGTKWPLHNTWTFG